VCAGPFQNWFPDTYFFLAALHMTGCKVCQEAEVLTTTVTLEPGQHHQWDVESYVFQHLGPIVHIFLDCNNAGLHLSVSFYIASDLSP
jgi:hypothetical protein